MPGVVGMARKDGAGAIQLLGEDEAGERVGESKRSEREQEGRTAAGAVGPSVGGANGEGDVLNAFIAATADPGGEAFGSHLPPAAVEKNGERGGAALLTAKPFQKGIFAAKSGRFGPDDSRSALQIAAGEGIEGVSDRGTRTDVSQRKLHPLQNTVRMADAVPAPIQS